MALDEIHFHHLKVKHILLEKTIITTLHLFMSCMVVYHDVHVATYNIARFPTENSVTDSETVTM